MARRKADNPVSLFPFLAVLVCTMGALIFLLLATTRQIQKDLIAAAAPAKADQPTETPSLKDEVASFVVDPEKQPPSKTPQEFRTSLFPPSPVEELEDAVSRRQSSISKIKSEIRKRLETLEAVERRIAELETDSRKASEAQARQRKAAEAERQKLEKLREEERQLLAVLKEHQHLLKQLQERVENETALNAQAEKILRNRESALVSLRQMAEAEEESTMAAGGKTLLEFSNPEGTSRSPLVVEVSGEGFHFPAGGVTIKSTDMEGFPVRDNPLLSGILAVHDSRNPNQLTSRPYVLLLVRPDGSLGFYQAQRTLKEAGIHYGYELVDSEMAVHIPEAKLQERVALEKSLVAALERRRKLYADAMRRVEALRRSAQRSDSGGRRALQVLPDGRIVDRQNESDMPGRFYAGGEAPPRGALSPIPDRGPRGRQSGQQGGLRPGRVQPRIAGQTVDNARQGVAGRAADNEIQDADVQPLIVARNAESARPGDIPSTENGNPEFSPARQQFDNLIADTVQQPSGAANEHSHSAAQRPQGWPDQAFNGTNPATRTSPVAGQAASAEVTDPNGDPYNTSGTGVPLPFGASPNETASANGSSFRRPHPYLVALLKRAQQRQQPYYGSSRRLSEHQAPAAAVRNSVPVTLSPGQITVGQHSSGSTADWTQEDYLAFVLKQLRTQISIPAAGSVAGARPSVTFLAGPGSDRVLRYLSRELQKLSIHTSTVSLDDPSQSPESEEKQEPAEPIDVQPPPGSVRGVSL